jgi:hypothetical protein
MKRLLEAIGFQSSKNDRLVLKWFLIVCCLIASAIGVVILLVLLPIVWNPQAKRDSAKLDSLLSSQKIDSVDFISLYMTNTITGIEGQKIVASLDRTNRMNATDLSKAQGQQVILRNGTNAVCRLDQFDSGTWSFGEYDFRLRQ